MKSIKILMGLLIVLSLSSCAMWHEMWGQPHEAHAAPPIDEHSIHSNYPAYEPHSGPRAKKPHARPEYYELPDIVKQNTEKS